MRGLEALIQLIDLETEEVVMESQSGSSEGSYLLSLPTDRDYALNVSADGYLFYSGHFAFRGEHSMIKPFRRDIPMDRILVGSRVVLNNVFFDTDSYRLKPASGAELDKLYNFLTQNPMLKVELSGHTDNTGSPEYNRELSLQRALAVKSYLAERGIKGSRISAGGYGAEEPVADNDTEEGRAQNRRTELIITGMNE
jgi:outer membrane protein OmpA-like peptidoglycan-associated protein